jgi:hypothetical protein
MKSLMLVFSIAGVVAANVLPATAQQAPTCSARLDLCITKCADAQRMGPEVCRNKCRANHRICMKTGTFPVIGPYGPWPGLERR